MKHLILLMSVACLLGTSPAPASQSPIGTWSTVDEKSGKVRSRVEVYEQGGKLFGRIVGLPRPMDEQGHPRRCRACEGADKDRPIVGLVIIRDLSPSGDRYRGGTILDPDDGKVYRAEIWVDGDTLKVRGFLGPFYRTQTWLRDGH